MIKVSQIDVHRLVEFVRSYEVQPDWMSMQLPLGTSTSSRPVPLGAPLNRRDAGRNMNQCISAAQAMGLAHLQPPLIPSAPIKRKSVGDLNNEPPPKKLAMTQIELQPTPYQRLQPRPSPGGPNSFPAGPVLSPTVPPPNPPKKRGRPTKANKEAQARNGSSGSLPPILAPMPLAPRDPAPPPAQDPGQNPPFAYRVSPGPRDPKTKKRGGKGATPDKSQPVGSVFPGVGGDVLMTRPP